MKFLRRLGLYFVPHWAAIVFSMACMGVVGATAGVSAWLVKPVLDGIFIEKSFRKLQLLPLAIIGLYLLKGVCRYLQSYLMRWVGETVVLKMRQDLLTHLQYREIAFFDRNPTGGLMARVTNDVGAMQGAIPDFIQLLRQSFTVMGLLAVLFYRDWKLALVSLTIFPLAAYPLRRISVLMRRYARKSQATVGDISNILQEAFSGIEVVKIFRYEEREIERFRVEGERLRRTHLKSARLNEISAPFMELLGAVGASLIIWYGGRQVLSGATTAGSFFSFLTALFMLYDPLKRAGSLNNSFQQALAAAERVFGVMDEPVAACEIGGRKAVGLPVEEVAFVDVRFSYDPAKGEVLRGVSFCARRGQVVALVGSSGAGKSTVLKLLPRFYDPDSGSVRINGIDLREYALSSLRGAVAVVTQETFLFNDTVKRNLLVGRPDASDEDIVAAARAGNAHGFIDALPNGYDTVIGERGDLLSGGQKQRIAIARAILKDAPILVLDEATSALDSASEKEVQMALENLMAGRTTLVIAHRLSTVRHADQILVLKEGCVEEVGSHDELLARGGEYARLCRLQFGETEPLSDLLVGLAPLVGRGYLRLVGGTTRYRYENREALERARAFHGPVVLALWHNRLLGPIFPGRGQGMGVVISRSRDGEIARRLVEGFGFKALRGSTSRGGAAALRAVLRHVSEGLDVAFTPDGPRGPRYTVQLGTAYAARKTGLPVVPLGVGMSKKMVFSSWDRFQLPLPFGVIQFVFGEPLLPGSGADDGAAAERIRRALLDATERADSLLGVTSP